MYDLDSNYSIQHHLILQKRKKGKQNKIIFQKSAWTRENNLQENNVTIRKNEIPFAFPVWFIYLSNFCTLNSFKKIQQSISAS